MCGLFGVIRSERDRQPQGTAAVFAALGRMAERRGQDAAGFAVVDRTGVGRVVKATRPFGRLWVSGHAQAVSDAHVVLGHTRHATDGAADVLANAAPLMVGGGLVGTHNGQVDTGHLRASLPAGLAAPRGQTDSEVLLLALDRAGYDLDAVCQVLSAMRGPSALAWADPRRAGCVYLGRGALCPLALATDLAGSLWWASSPAWFRHVDRWADGQLGFQVERVREGTLLALEAGEQPAVVAEREFVPVARPGDEERFPSIWAGLDPEDVAAFRAEARYLVAAAGGPAQARRDPPRGGRIPLAARPEP